MTILSKTRLHTLLFTPGAILAAGLLTASPLFAQGQAHPQHSPGSQKPSHSAKSFIKEAAEGNLGEIQMGQLGEQKSQNAQIKQLAQRLVQDHTQANQNLQQIAQNEGVEWPKKPEHHAEKLLKDLEKLSGSKFDQKFAEHSIRDHTRDIQKYEHAQNSIQDPALKNYIQTSLPKLQEHLQLSIQAAQAVGVPQQKITSLQKGLPRGMGAPGSVSGTQSGTRSGGQRKGGWPYGGNQ